MSESFSLGYRYVLDRQTMYQPRTLSSALRAFRQGALPAEGVALFMNSLTPIAEQGTDLNAIDWLLSLPQLDLKIAQALLEFLDRLVHHPSAETALFAAESSSVLEARFAKAAQAASRRFRGEGGGQDPALFRELVRSEYRLLVLNSHRPAIQRHHAQGIVRLFDRNRRWFRLKLSDTLRLLAAHRALGRSDRARRLLDACRACGVVHPRLDLVAADLAFRDGRVNEAAALGRGYGARLAFWSPSTGSRP